MLPRRHERWLSPVLETGTGFVAGATGVFVIPAVPYVQALGFDRNDLVQALGFSFTVSTVALAIGLAIQGTFHLDEMTLSALAVVPALIGMWAGQYIRRAVTPAMFKRCFLTARVLLGAEIMSRGVWSSELWSDRYWWSAQSGRPS